MELSEDEIVQKYAKYCGHCNRNTSLPYEYEFSCFSCGYNVIRRKQELTKLHRRKLNFINGIKYAEQKIFCICMHVCKIYEGDDYNKLYDMKFYQD